MRVIRELGNVAGTSILIMVFYQTSGFGVVILPLKHEMIFFSLVKNMWLG